MYSARRGPSRGRRYTIIGVAVLVVVLGAAATWQVITAPRILAVSPTPDTHTPKSSLTIVVRVDGADGLNSLSVSIDGEDVSDSVVVEPDRLLIRTPELEDGTHLIALQAGTGNLYRRSLSRSWSFVVDTAPPPLTVREPKAGTSFTTTPITFAGTTEAGGEVAVQGFDGTVKAGPDGAFSLPVVPSDGKLTMQVRARDRAGNITSVDRRIVVDTQAPTLQIPILGTVATNKPKLTVSVSDAVSTPLLKVSVDDDVVFSKRVSGSRTVKLGELAEGNHTVLVVASDRAGHQQTEYQAVLVDSTEKLIGATLAMGAVGKDVETLQKLLKRNHVYKGSLTSVYDAATADAVRRFQKRFSLTEDGVAGPSVVTALSGRILVDQSELRLYLYLNGKLKLTYRVATGMPAYPTPNGLFKVVVMAKNPTWIPPDSPWAKGLEPIPPGAGNPLGTRWIGTSAPGVGIHGTPADWSIGSYASHGCIRMHVWEVEKLYEYVKVGMPVVIRW